MNKVAILYDGPGSEIFPDLHWAPEPGDTAEFDEELVLDADGKPNHPAFRLAQPPKSTGSGKPPTTTNTEQDKA